MAAKKVVRLVVLGAVVAGGVIYSMHWWRHGRWLQGTDNAYLRADISLITPRVAGEVVEVAVHDNQPVKKGDVLVRIDPRDYEARLASAKAQVAQAEAALITNGKTQDTQAAVIDEARAALAASSADQHRLQKDYTRADALVRDGVATTARLDTATAAFTAAKATVARGAAGLKAAQAQSATLIADRARLEAQVQAAQAAEKLAELDLESTTLRAPIDGVVGNLAAKTGERVNAGIRLLSLVATDSLWVEANYKETQLTRMVVGQPVKVRADAFPDVTIAGTVQSFSPASGAEFALLPPDNATGNFTKIVQRLPVKIALTVPAELADKLRPGLSVEAVVDTKPR